jgi:hypothetical protein
MPRLLARCLHRTTLRRSAAAAAVALLLAGCATPDRVAPGTPRAQVIERFGAPQTRYALPTGGERLEYGGGPMQETWMVDVDASGRVLTARQVRTSEHFATLRPGIDGPDHVQREFGTPWRIERYALSGLTAWMYPYKEAGVWNSMMALHFDDAGRLVRVENGPDPRFLGGRGRDD